mmetsp:Transcript_17235/g.53005  ORF Transcript_17235/g.53005 Transcript_17235/m.53005 type:complete len:159 (+) Transcript_17235:170-646(+)
MGKGGGKKGKRHAKAQASDGGGGAPPAGGFISSGRTVKPEGIDVDRDVVLYPDFIDPARFQGLAVMTSNGNVQAMLENWASKDPKGYPNCIARIKKSICKYTNQQLIDMDTDSQNWKDWVDEVLLYITLNTVMTDAPIPMQFRDDLPMTMGDRRPPAR